MKKFFLIFGMSDETFALTSASKIPEGTDKGWYLLWITWLDETYWVIGATLGGLIGPFLTFDLKGLDFVLTAMFTAIFADNWLREKDHTSSISGLLSRGCASRYSVPTISSSQAWLSSLYFSPSKKEKYDSSPTNHHGFSRRSRHHAYPFHPFHRLPAGETYT